MFAGKAQTTSGVSQLARRAAPILLGAALTAWLDELFRGIKFFRINEKNPGFLKLSLCPVES